MKIKLFTIGVYQTIEATFFEALITHQIDTFCDVRARRGLRGKDYAYANSQYLQARLNIMNIRYLHFKDLAPTADIRAAEQAEDKRHKIAKRQRDTLSDTFVAQYRTKILMPYNAETFLKNLPPDAQRVVLFCVEQIPAACHRSLLAAYLAEALGLEVEHIVP